MKTAVMRAEAVPPEAPKGNRKQSADCMECAETRPTASSRQALAEPIVAGLACTSHPGRREWRIHPQYGRRLPLARRSSSPLIRWVCFRKQTHMMTPVKTEKRHFPPEIVCFGVQGWGNQKAFFRKQTQMIQPRPSAFHPYCNPSRFCFPGRILDRKRTQGTLSEERIALRSLRSLAVIQWGCGFAALGRTTLKKSVARVFPVLRPREGFLPAGHVLPALRGLHRGFETAVRLPLRGDLLPVLPEAHGEPGEIRRA